MIERGVRFVTVTLPRVQQDGRWDAHGNLVDNHTQHALTVDQPIGALLGDLKERGLLESTLVVFATEFGYKAIENKLLIHNFHATILHLLGIEHTELTYRHGGRDYRLTDVHRRVFNDMLA